MTAQAGDTPSQSKAAWRAQLRQTRAKIPLAKKRSAARRAAGHALRLIEHLRARHVAIYAPLGSELDTGPLRERLRGTVYLPRLKAGKMRFVPLRSAQKMDLILLPLVGFDAKGTRLGQGGGHYDRTLAFARGVNRPLLVGYAFAMQEVDSLPREEHDVRLDAVITEKGLRWLTG